MSAGYPPCKAVVDPHPDFPKTFLVACRPRVAPRSRRAACARTALAAVTLAVATPSAAAAQTSASYTPTDGYVRVAGVDVLHYEIRVALPDEGTSIEGRTGILFEVRDEGLRELPLDFGALTVDSVEVNGAPTRFRHESPRLSVALPPLEREARGEVVVWYHGSPRDGLFLQRNRHGAPTVFADNWPDRARQWFPGIDHPSDKATVDFVVEAPSRMEVVANGRLLAVEDLGGDRRRTRWSESEELPTYNMVIGAADFAIQRGHLVNGVEISDWVFPEDSTAGARAFARSPEIVAFFDSLFGPFPFEKLANVQSLTRFGGMENSSAIFFDEKAVGTSVAPVTGSAIAAPSGGGDTTAAPSGGGDATAAPEADLTDLVAHETAHQWFGDAVTEADWHHLWLSEGFATYLAAVFFEFHGGPGGRGPAELTRRMREAAGTVFADENEKSRPIVDPAETDLFALLNSNNYEKAAWVLHMLRHETGDAAFFGGVRDYYADFKGGTAWTADFEHVMEQAVGRDLGWFFRQWLDRPGWPVLEVEQEAGGAGKTRVRVRQVQPGPAYRFTLELELVSAGGTRRERVEVSEREMVVTFDTPEPLRAVVTDPDAWLLHETRPAASPTPAAR